MGFDRITILVDHPAPEISHRKITQHCRKLEILDSNSQKYHPGWQTIIRLYQPTRRALIELQAQLGPRCRTYVRYAELAFDLITSGFRSSGIIHDFMLEHFRLPYVRQSVWFEKGTAYFARRASSDGKKVGANFVIYSDKPSKLKRFRDKGQPCCHLEYRFQGVEMLAQHGLLTLSDCIDFDHQAFWRDNLRLYMLPKKVELGRRLDPRGTQVSDTALTKRANTLLGRYRYGEAVVLQDLWREQPLIAKLVKPIDNSLFIRGVTS